MYLRPKERLTAKSRLIFEGRIENSDEISHNIENLCCPCCSHFYIRKQRLFCIEAVVFISPQNVYWAWNNTILIQSGICKNKNTDMKVTYRCLIM